MKKVLYYIVYIMICIIALIASYQATKCGCNIIAIYIMYKLVNAIWMGELNAIVLLLVDPYER